MVSFYFPFESVDVQNIWPRYSGTHEIPQLVRVGSGGALACPAIDSRTISAAASKESGSAFSQHLAHRKTHPLSKSTNAESKMASVTMQKTTYSESLLPVALFAMLRKKSVRDGFRRMGAR